MFRKTSVALAALLVATTAAISPAALAATKISNGVVCTKKNATTKVGTDKYTCTTNPTATGTAAKKLVWVWSGCLDADKSYKDTKAQYDTLLLNASKADKNLQANISAQINSLIVWKSARTYTKGEIVYEEGKTYFIALTESKNISPSSSIGVNWEIFQPNSANPGVGTAPDSATAISLKQKDIDDWSTTVSKLTENLTKLQDIKNPDVKTKSLISQTQSLILTLNSGIRNAKTKINNLNASIKLLDTQNANQQTLLSLKSNVTQALDLRSKSCAKGV